MVFMPCWSIPHRKCGIAGGLAKLRSFLGQEDGALLVSITLCSAALNSLSALPHHCSPPAESLCFLSSRFFVFSIIKFDANSFCCAD